ncbi:MAG TPA: hypothetical protein VGE02_03725 [Gemmatimonadales bacterium]
MDCRTFREHHCAFIDDTLPASDVVAMERHRLECGKCAELDTRVRRSLLLVRNLPPIECSAEFTNRLLSRLRETEVDRRPVLTARTPGIGAFVAVAAGIFMVTLGSLAVLEDEAAPSVVVLQPVVATQPPPPPQPADPLMDPLTSPVILATSAAGIPAWPAVVLAEEMPMRMAESEFRMYSASW